MLRAIWSAMVVLPAPWAPPISISSPGRSPPPIVLSRGTKPVPMGWNSSTLPDAIRSLRLVRTSRADRGARAPASPSRRQSAAAGLRSASGSAIGSAWGSLVGSSIMGAAAPHTRAVAAHGAHAQRRRVYDSLSGLRNGPKGLSAALQAAGVHDLEVGPRQLMQGVKLVIVPVRVWSPSD